MNVAALFSGGKDSAYAMYLAQQQGLTVTHLVTIVPEKNDSWMFHSVNIHLTKYLAEAMGIPLVNKHTKGIKEDELQDLKEVLATLDIDAVVSGAIASEYQRSRVEAICQDLRIKSLTPMWQKDQEELLHEQVDAGFTILIVGVFAHGFDESWLGRKLDKATIEEISTLRKKYAINAAGEGGEFETLVLNGPIFQKRLVLDDVSKHWKRDSGVLQVNKAHLE